MIHSIQSKMQILSVSSRVHLRLLQYALQEWSRTVTYGSAWQQFMSVSQVKCASEWVTQKQVVNGHLMYWYHLHCQGLKAKSGDTWSSIITILLQCGQNVGYLSVSHEAVSENELFAMCYMLFTLVQWRNKLKKIIGNVTSKDVLWKIAWSKKYGAAWLIKKG